MNEMNNTALAEKAFEKCQEHYKRKEYDMARVFCLNAISHYPDLKYFSSYAAIVCKMPDETRTEAIEQAINILQMALLQVAAENVIPIKEILDALLEQSDNYFQLLPEYNDGRTKSDISFLKDVISGEFSWKSLAASQKIDDLVIIQHRIEFLQNALSQGSLDHDSSRICQSELEDTLSYLEFINHKKIITEHLEQIEQAFKSEIPQLYYISSRLQNINTLLSQMWLCKTENVLPDTEILAILNGLIQKIQYYENKYNECRSFPIYEDITGKVDTALKNSLYASSGLTARINALEEVIKSLSSRIMELTSLVYVEKAQKKMADLGQQVVLLSKQRYARYQSKAAKICAQAIKSYDDTTFVTENDALKYLEKHEIAKINESLLAPETSSLYHSAKGILTAKLSRIHNAEFQVKCVESPKFSLEDF